jgi:isoleucyl-tRNA synthetase
MDKWLLSKLNSMVEVVDYNLANYRIPEAARTLQEFVDEMSNWYVRRGRERYWVQGMTDDKLAAYMTLYHALVITAKTAAPMIPFMAENIYQNLVTGIDKTAPESIHLCSFPEVDKSAIDKNLEEQMKKVLDIVVLGRAARNGSSRKNRQPLNTMYVKLDGALEDSFIDIIKEELNIKTVVFESNLDEYMNYSLKPNFKVAGPMLGKNIKAFGGALAKADPAATVATIEAEGKVEFDSTKDFKLFLVKLSLFLKISITTSSYSSLKSFFLSNFKGFSSHKKSYIL